LVPNLRSGAAPVIVRQSCSAFAAGRAAVNLGKMPAGPEIFTRIF
jgi:hypothetical protein